MVVCPLVVGESFLVAFAAERLIFGCLAQQYTLVVGHETVADISQVAAFHADGMHLGHIVGNGAEAGNGTEWNAFEVHVESCNNDAHTAVGQCLDDFHEAVAMVPGMGDDKKGKVIDCVQTGYTLNDKVIRHAKVAVGQ